MKRTLELVYVSPYARKRWQRRGSEHGRAKLDETRVLSIVAEREAGATLQELADAHGVSTWAISNILSGANWAWLTGLP